MKGFGGARTAVRSCQILGPILCHMEVELGISFEFRGFLIKRHVRYGGIVLMAFEVGGQSAQLVVSFLALLF